MIPIIQTVLIVEIIVFILFMVVGIIYTNKEETVGSIAFYSFGAITLIALFVYSLPLYVLDSGADYSKSKLGQGFDLAQKVVTHPLVQSYINRSS